ncbi:MAG: ankyrin repeat domain-containing protein [Alphaproteobacteria bacterium]
MTNIFEAISENNISLIKEILSNTPKVLDSTNEFDMTPLNWAVLNGNSAVINALVKEEIIFNKDILAHNCASQTYASRKEPLNSMTSLRLNLSV